MSIKAVSWAFEQRVNDPIAKLVLIGIADRYNDERGYAWPAVKWLADIADCAPRTAQRKLALLEELGMIERRMRRNGKTNESTHYYIPHIGGGDTQSPLTELCHEGGDTAVTPGGVTEPCHPNNRNNYINNKDMLISFDQFWEVVPRKVGKKAAQKAFRIALKDVDADQIIAAMTAYARKVVSEKIEPQFICHPSTWLNEGRWDDVEAARPAVSENFGISQRWMPASREDFAERYNRMPEWYRLNRPDVLRMARANGWLNE